MIYCKICGAINSDNANICEECSVVIDEKILPKDEKEGGDFADQLSKSIASGKVSISERTRKADIMFVFDCTGSMGGEIRAMQDAIIDFANSIQSDGLDILLGLIEFRDRMIGEEPKLHKFNGDIFTKKMSKFQKAVDTLKATGGGPIPESSPDAIMLALNQNFRNIPNKTIVLITDAPPNIPDKSTKSLDEVIKKLKEKEINQFYVVTMLRDKKCQIHLRLLEGVHKYGGDGLAFELSKKDADRNQHFKKVLRGLAKSISSKSI